MKVLSLFALPCLLIVSCVTPERDAEVIDAPYSFLLERLQPEQREAYIKQWSHVPIPVSMKVVQYEPIRKRLEALGLLDESLTVIVAFRLDRQGNVAEAYIAENPVSELDDGTIERVILETVEQWKFARPAPMSQSDFITRTFHQPIVF